jgi:hypothetical protein
MSTPTILTGRKRKTRTTYRAGKRTVALNGHRQRKDKKRR